MKSILDRSFQYTPSFRTDLKATFARIRRDETPSATTQPDEAAQSAPADTTPTGSAPSAG